MRKISRFRISPRWSPSLFKSNNKTNKKEMKIKLLFFIMRMTWKSSNQNVYLACEQYSMDYIILIRVAVSRSLTILLFSQGFCWTVQRSTGFLFIRLLPILYQENDTKKKKKGKNIPTKECRRLWRWLPVKRHNLSYI